MIFRVLPLAFLLAMAAGCRAVELQAEPDSAPAVVPAVPVTHQPVPEPPEAIGSSPVLWVSLDDHLGRSSRSPLLTLRSASGPLTLEDATGLRWSSATISISWRSVPLDAPVKLARRVAGPFASFESAERVAQRWRGIGVNAEVAHPGDWEVWAPKASPVPDGLRVRDWSGSTAAVIKAVLERAEGGTTLTGPIQIKAPNGLLWKGGLYRGPFRLQRDAYGSWTLVEQVPIERYLEGVVPHEIGAGSPTAALQAQTVLARTWALANSHRFRIDGYHLCSDTQCQVYSDPRQAGGAVRQAIQATSGRLLSWQGQPISAVYHASNGGVMVAGTEAWAMDPTPYLKAEADGEQAWRNRHQLPLSQTAAVDALLQGGAGAHGTNHPLFRWSRTLTAPEIKRSLGAEGAGLTLPLSVSVVERGASGRVLALKIAGSGDAPPVILRLDRIRRTLRRLPSTLFVITPQAGGSWFVRGGGFGHGSGLSQAGAIDLAWRGWSTEKILRHYYPGTVYGPLPKPVQAP